MLRRALDAMPGKWSALRQTGGVARVRTDAGYFTGDLARAAVIEGCDFTIAAKRNTAMWRAYASIPDDAWVDAMGMPGAQVPQSITPPAGGPRTPTRSCGGSVSMPRRSRPTPGPGGAAPSTPTNSHSRSTAPPPTPTWSRSTLKRRSGPLSGRSGRGPSLCVVSRVSADIASIGPSSRRCCEEQRRLAKGRGRSILATSLPLTQRSHEPSQCIGRAGGMQACCCWKPTGRRSRAPSRCPSPRRLGPRWVRACVLLDGARLGAA